MIIEVPTAEKTWYSDLSCCSVAASSFPSRQCMASPQAHRTQSPDCLPTAGSHISQRYPIMTWFSSNQSPKSIFGTWGVPMPNAWFLQPLRSCEWEIFPLSPLLGMPVIPSRTSFKDESESSFQHVSTVGLCRAPNGMARRCGMEGWRQWDAWTWILVMIFECLDTHLAHIFLLISLGTFTLCSSFPWQYSVHLWSCHWRGGWPTLSKPSRSATQPWVLMTGRPGCYRHKVWASLMFS